MVDSPYIRLAVLIMSNPQAKHEGFESPFNSSLLCESMIAGFFREGQQKSHLLTCGLKKTCGYAGKVFEPGRSI
jgi:hypothetical protein